MKRVFISLLLILSAQSVFADLQCNVNTPNFYALYKINQYTCATGEFLPANTLGCESCPSGYTCDGGTYNFNATNFQGVNLEHISSSVMTNVCANNFPQKLSAYYKRNQHTCAAGYYLPANIDGCTICPQNNICAGGTFSFNETTDQGIESCNGGFAPSGSSSVCYPHVLHVGDDVVYLSATKRTTPSLNVEVNGTVFYANITATPTYMSSTSTHFFKTIVNDTEHYICDETSCPNAE